MSNENQPSDAAEKQQQGGCYLVELFINNTGGRYLSHDCDKTNTGVINMMNQEFTTESNSMWTDDPFKARRCTEKEAVSWCDYFKPRWGNQVRSIEHYFEPCLDCNGTGLAPKEGM